MTATETTPAIVEFRSGKKKQLCYHCGDVCDDSIQVEEKPFCCTGCKQVYLLLNENNLCSYYDLDKNPGLKARGKFSGERFAYLDDPSIIKQLSHFYSEQQVNISFSLPQMHCSSCVFLLENLHKIDPGVTHSRVNFQRKEIFVTFNPTVISLRKLVELLAFIGYEPAISLDQAQDRSEDNKPLRKSRFNRIQVFRIGVAGFCFANIMMTSFPEYLSSGHVEESLKGIFTWLNFGLSLPVLFFASAGIFESAWKGLRQRTINIDAPIVLAILVTFGRSYYEIFTGTGAGYLDSGTGIVFFMLIGRWFQSKTYDSLSFDRDYRSYFPLGVTIVTSNNVAGYQLREEKNIPVTKLKEGDRIIIRNNEMIPADAILLKGDARVDYSFVNGENTPVEKQNGQLLYAGGRQTGTAIELEVKRKVSQSYITELWNNDVFRQGKKVKESFLDPWSRYFTLALFSIALAAVLFWWVKDPNNILPALTSVLIVACPCSLLLSGTFTNGNMLRIFGRNKMYMKNAGVIESLAETNDIVFDKTGTITEPALSRLQYHGIPLTQSEKEMIVLLAGQSSHPLGKLIAAQLDAVPQSGYLLNGFSESSGKGVEATIDGIYVKLGSPAFLNMTSADGTQTTAVHIQVGNEYKGYFGFNNHYRKGIRKTMDALRNNGYTLHVLSGDNDTEMDNLRYIFGEQTNIRFRQLPVDKLEYIKELQQKGRKVLMVGDGLNDAGALMQADTGVAVNDSNTQFTPACDAILDGSRVSDLNRFMQYARSGKKIIAASFALSILYNFVGLSFAVSASLSPMVAAILMPASSISIVLFVTIAGNLVGKKFSL